MKVSRKALAAALLLAVAGGAFAVTEAEIKQQAQTVLQQAQQLSSQNDSDFAERNVSSEGNTAEAKFKYLKHRLDTQAAVVEREKSHIDVIIASGRTAKKDELNRYERSIAEYARRVQDLEEWTQAN
jgi:phenylalanyl-tRNA synthetase alpha subunit